MTARVISELKDKCKYDLLIGPSTSTFRSVEKCVRKHSSGLIPSRKTDFCEDYFVCNVLIISKESYLNKGLDDLHFLIRIIIKALENCSFLLFIILRRDDLSS